MLGCQKYLKFYISYETEFLHSSETGSQETSKFLPSPTEKIQWLSNENGI